MKDDDYLTPDEAARYCKVSIAKFNRMARAYGLAPGRPMGKPLYRRADLERALEANWSAGTALGAYQRETRRLTRALRPEEKPPAESGEVVPLPRK